MEGFLGGKGEPVDAAGESAYPGNTNQFIVKISEYARCLEASEGQVPEFVCMCMYMYVYVCMYVCMYVRTYVRTYAM